MIHAIPGDPVRAAVGLTAPPEVVAAQRAQYGLDDPIAEQYIDFIGRALRGDLGDSIVQRRPVVAEIRDGLPHTLRLAGWAFALTILAGVPSGVAVAVLSHGGRGRVSETIFAVFTGVLTVIPQFLMGVLLVFVFAVKLGVLPVAGRAGGASYVLPVLALGLGPAALLARIVRVETHRVLDQSFILTARAKRLPPIRIYLRHVLPNAMAATLTVAGAILGSLLAGTVLIEYVFAWPGLGTTLVESITGKDYAMAQGLALVFGAAVLIINMAVDFALAVFDPRSTMVGS